MRKWILMLLAALLLATLAPMAAGAEAAPADVPAAEEPAAAEEVAEEPAEEAEPGWLVSVFGKIGEWKWYTVAVLVALIAFALIATLGMKNARWSARELALAAMCIAIAFVLSSIRMYRMPQGGTVSLAALLPLVLFAMAFGPVKGFIAGCALGLLQLMQDPYIIHPVQLLLDYPLAFASVALCCVAKLFKISTRGQLLIAIPLAYFGKFAMSVISGVVFFSEYAGPEGALLYSMGYNIAYTAPEALLAMVLVLVPGVERLAEGIRRPA